MTSLLKGTTAFITGAASGGQNPARYKSLAQCRKAMLTRDDGLGIGKATALSFARHGVQRLALADIDSATLRTSCAELAANFRTIDVLPLQMDVRVGAEVTTALSEVARRFGRLDIAVNNAGVGGRGQKTHETAESEFIGLLDVNLNGVWRCQREELRIMTGQKDLGIRKGRGSIINVASMFGLIAPGSNLAHTAYTAAKHGVLGLTKGDANTYSSYNIRINAICPGYVETPLMKAVMDQSEGSPIHIDRERTPLGRLAQLEEVGDAITFLASPLSSFMQGAALVVDGGFTTQ